MARKPGRPHAGQEILSRKRIVTAALALIDVEGDDALTMRRLASVLQVDPMSIYRHIPDKQALMDQVVEAVFGELRMSATETTSWKSQVRQFAQAYMAVARAHPYLVLHLVAGAEAGMETVMAAVEHLFAALAASGLPPRVVLRCSDLIIDYLNGYALGELSGKLGAPDERAGMLTRLSAFPAEQFPAIRAVYSCLSIEEMQGQFEVGLEILLAGIESRRATAK